MSTKAQEGVARSYARALFSLAKERRLIESVTTDLQTIREQVAGDAVLRAFFARPWVAAGGKRAVAADVAAKLNLSPLMQDFLALVAARGRVDHLEAIADAYRGLVDDEVGRVRARVRTAVPLTQDERTTLAARLGRAFGGHQVVIDEVVDRNLLGGFVAESGSLVVDGSLDGQLDRLRERLARG
ncbi:MAG: ATP synthase F1 subunit delta [Candidatus Rokuibacteriota bacterium]